MSEGVSGLPLSLLLATLGVTERRPRRGRPSEGVGELGRVLRKTGVLALNADTTFFTCVKGERGEPCGRRSVSVEDDGCGVAVLVSVLVTDDEPVRPVKVDAAVLEGVLLYPLVSDCERECCDPGVRLESTETELGALGPETIEPVLLLVGDVGRDPCAYKLLPYPVANPNPLVVTPYPSPVAGFERDGIVWLKGIVA